MNLKNKNVLIFGMGDSGRAVANLLKKHHAHVSFYDDDINFFGSIGFEKNPTSIDWDLVVLSPGVKVLGNKVLDELKKKSRIISEIDLACMFCKGKIVAVTGTNGKTTVCMLTHKILKTAGFDCLLCGNIGLPFSSVCEKATKKTIVVCEVSSFQLECSKVFHANVACVLNIQPDHLDRHLTFQNYMFAKSKIAERQNRRDVLILNLDDDNSKKLARKQHTQFFSKNALKKGVYLQNEKFVRHVAWENRGIAKRKNGLSGKNTNVALSAGKTVQKAVCCDKIIFENKKPIMPVRDIPLLGEKNLENVLAAVAICRLFGVSGQVVWQVVKGFSAASHRMEIVGCLDGVTYVDDSKATNVSSTIACIEAFSGKQIFLLVGGQGKETGYQALFGRGFSIKQVVCFGADASAIEKCATEFGYVCHQFEHLFDAVEFCKKNAQTGDYVLLSPACASFDEFSSYAERGEAFTTQILGGEK